MPSKIKCRFCQGIRDVIGNMCAGCGSPIENAIDRSKPKQEKVKCVHCQSVRKVQEIESGRYACAGCGSVFESDDFASLDTRPDVNLEKKERMQRRRRRGRS